MFHFHGSHHSHAKDLAYFDIRLKSAHNNTVLVKGNEFEVANIPIHGSVKILTQEDLHVKRVRLQLVGEYHMEYCDRHHGHAATQVYEKNCVLKVVWPNLLTSSQGEIQFGCYGDQLVKMHKVDSHLKRSRDSSSSNLSALNNSSLTSLSEFGKPGYSRTTSQPNLLLLHDASLFAIPKSGVDGTPFPLSGRNDSHSFLLPQGNYSMPFHIELPSNVSESVEGLRSAKLLYKLECVVERGRFERSFTTAKHMRIVRTLHPRNLTLTDSIEFNNTWPGKVEFSVSMPRKGLALGTSVPIKLVVVPLVKGPTFKSMTAEIVQHHHVKGLAGESPEFEEFIAKQKLDCDDSFFGEDHWVIKSTYHLPTSLKEVVQTCTLKDEIVLVKHRIRVLMHIRNADGHISELRANLPVHIYLSAHHGKATSRHLEIDPHHGHFTAEDDPDREDSIFHRRERLAEDDDDSSEAEVSDREEDNAPPMYQHHVHDTVYDQSSPRTPLEQLRINGIKSSLEDYFNLPGGGSGALSPPIDVNLLLRVPSYERAVNDDSEYSVEEPAPQYDHAQSRAESSPAESMKGRFSARSASTSNMLLHHNHRLLRLHHRKDH